MAKLRYKPPHVPDFNKIRYAVTAGVNSVLRPRVAAFAEKSKDGFVARVKQQKFTSFVEIPLSAGWLFRKRMAGADERVMIATGHYLSSIRVFERAASLRRRIYHIGFHRNAMARNLEGQVVPLPLHILAAVQERGSERIGLPARPHWMPYLRVIRQQAIPFRRQLGREFVSFVRSRLKGWKH